MSTNGLSTKVSEGMLNHNLKTTSILMIIISILTLITSIVGVFYDKIYLDLMEEGYLTSFAVAGSVNQDILSIICGFGLLAMALMLLKNSSYKLLITAMGLLGYIFYGYGVYTFGIMLTPFYLMYIIIFALSIYCFAFGFLSIDAKKIADKIKLSTGLGKSIGIFFVIMATVLSIKWIVDILTKSLSETQPELYLIAAMDLTFALPVICFAGIMLLRRKLYGILLSGIALIKIFTLCLSVAIGTFIAPRYDLAADYGTFYFFSLLTAISLTFMILYLREI